MRESTESLIQTYFEKALDLTPKQRESFIHETIDQESVRQEVLSLLEAYESSDGFLERPALSSNGSIDEITKWANPDAQLVGETIGSCRLTRVIASGGMGTVYEAEQAEPKRRVAVKLMRRRLQSKHARRRFEYETQILARLHHPGIAQILEAGTQDGEPLDVPYFVMEYIEDARSLTDYAREKDLPLRGRIELFIEICEAVHHGHLRGVIHRDLKPENILIDREGRPRIIDFGVAKATDHDLAISTLITETGQLVGTLQYMSPEQCDGEGSQIDLRSDVYSLGIILYELLCDELPYDLASAKPVEALRIVREQGPRRPSDTNRMLRGDLDTIILKTLVKERERRYESAAALAADLKRYMDNEPIAARPPSAIYQLGKFARRNRTLVGSGAIIAVLLIAGIISTSVGWNRAAQAESEALSELTRANAVAALIDDLFSSADPHERKDPDFTVRQLLDEFGGTIGDQFEGQPLVEASIRHTVGKAYLGLGLPDEAEPQLQAALDLQTQQLGEHDPIVLQTNKSLVMVYHDRGEYEKTERIIRKLLEQSAEVEGLDSLRQSLTATLVGLARHLGRYDEAESLYLETLEIQTRVLGKEHESTLRSMSSLAGVYMDQLRYAEAEPLMLKTLELMKRVLGEEDESTLVSMHNLAKLYKRQGRDDEAESLYVKKLEIQKRVLGDEHKDTHFTRHFLALFYKDQHRYDEAELLMLKTLELKKRILSDEHPDTLDSLNTLANLYTSQGRYAEAEPLFLETLEIQKRVQGEENEHTLASMNNLAILYKKQGRYAEAEPLYLETLEIMKRVLGEEHKSTLGSMTNLGILYSRLGRIDEAESLLSRSLSIKRRVLGTRDPFTQTAISYLAMLFWDQERLEEARTMFEEMLKIRQDTVGKENRHTLGTMTNLGNVYSDLGLYDKAEEMLTESLSTKRRVLDPRDVFIQNAFDSLAGLYEKQGREDERLALNEESLALRRKTLGNEHRRTLGAMTNLGSLYSELGRYDEAEKLLTESVVLKRRVLGIEDQWTRFAIGHLATLYEVTDRRSESLALRTELLDYLTEQAEDPDASAQELNAAAWDLLTIEHTELRDPARALPLAQRAVDKSGGNNPAVLDTLALAQHLTGDTAAAIETQRRAVELRPDDEGMAETLARYEAALQPDETERESDADKDN